MPEGPEVALIAHNLSAIYTGQTLVTIQYDARSKYAKSGLTSYPDLYPLLPLEVKKIFSHGKKIIFDLGGPVLLFSLGMEGRFKDHATPHGNLWLGFGSRIVLPDFDLNVLAHRLYFEDTRHFGGLTLYLTPASYQLAIGKLGIDVLATSVDSSTWVGLLTGKKWVTKQICQWLMDQSVISGVGNYLKAEILYRARVRPDRLVGSLTSEEQEALRQATHELIRASYQAQGATIATFENFDGQKGTFQMQVYGRKTDPTGQPVRSDTFKDGRTTHWVESHQH